MEQIAFKERKARKKHICDFCNRTIHKDEKYINQTNVKGGELYTWKSCHKCNTIFHDLDMSSMDDGYGIDSDTFMQTVYCYLDNRLCLAELDKVTYENRVDILYKLLGYEDN